MSNSIHTHFFVNSYLTCPVHPIPEKTIVVSFTVMLSGKVPWRREKAREKDYSSPLAWKMPWTEEPGRLQSMESLGVGHDFTFHFSLSCIGEGNGNWLQCSCLENPRDGEAWWAPVYGVAQSRAQLNRLSSSSSSPGEGNSNPLQYSCLENSMHRGAWWATVHGIAKSWTPMND